MASEHGSFIWYELLTDDPEVAQRFYTEVVGWSAAPFPGNAGMDYRVLSAPDGAGVGGIARSPTAGTAPMWLGYVSVRDVDAAVERATANGAGLRMAPTDIPQVGRIALLADPGGVPFYVMQPGMEGDNSAFLPQADGHCGWNELAAADLARDRDFYLDLFGWRLNGGMPMGDMGNYEFLEHEGTNFGAAMQNPPGRGPARWTYYFRVPSVTAAKARAEAAGGTIHFGPTEVPGGDWIIQGLDPQGASFALVGPKE